MITIVDHHRNIIKIKKKKRTFITLVQS